MPAAPANYSPAMDLGTARPVGEPPVPHPPREPGRSRLARVLLRVVAVLLLVSCGLLTLVAILGDTGPTGLVVGLLLAVVPVFPVVAVFLWLDRYEAEPRGLLLFAFGWGAFVATFAALVLNTASVEAIRAAGGDEGLVPVFVAPVVEEGAKGLAVLLVLLTRRREFDGVVDGIVYAGLAGIGFAFVENVLYLGRSLLEEGSAATAVVFVVRCLFSPFAHPLFTMATGVGLGLAASRRSPAVRVLAPLAGFVAAVLLHGLWNFSAVQGLQGFVGAYVALQVPVFLLAVAVAVAARAREGRLLRRHLGAYAASGWITGAEAAMLGSLEERRRARDWAGRTLGPGAERAMRDFQDLATELAFLRERVVRGTAPHDAPEAELRTLQAMWHLRRGFLPRPVEVR
ncbi:PrsW family intramembrane metalloprotease [Quadrisphaera sp. DSM 44207]|uniref:PrsW family intramembrane metalloprotease n=1 Tax=Quadrisphaera sp. DSM 44207 TaxID=1881057 RepID=UPI001C40AC18|nr:PrsW family intramembrane metalloprotease [Quadrisphaera sp. DSM 44207]